MFVLGHLGIGSKLVRPWSVGLRKRWVFLGALLPDLIDKPIYYGLSLAKGLQGAELGLISGTRTFGHTALFLVLLTLIGAMRKSKLLAAVSLGVASHLLLDNLGDHFAVMPDPDQSTLVALLFPFFGARFPVKPLMAEGEILSRLMNPYVLVGEILGGAILAWDFWKSTHRAEIASIWKSRRSWLRKRKKRDDGPR